MYFSINGDQICKDLIDALAEITNAAKVETKGVEYNKTEQTIRIPLIRFNKEYKRKLFGLINLPFYNYANPIESELIIHEIKDCKVTSNFDELDSSEIGLLFGVNIRGNNIFLVSVEEDKGEVLYSIDLTVNQINIELHDL